MTNPQDAEPVTVEQRHYDAAADFRYGKHRSLQEAFAQFERDHLPTPDARMVEALRRIAEHAGHCYLPDTPDEFRERIGWIEAELADEPYRTPYGSDGSEPCRNGYEVSELVLERAVLLALAAITPTEAGDDRYGRIHTDGSRSGGQPITPTEAQGDRIKYDDAACEAVQRLFERGKAYIDSDGYLTLVANSPTPTSELLPDEVEPTWDCGCGRKAIPVSPGLQVCPFCDTERQFGEAVANSLAALSQRPTPSTADRREADL